MSKDLLKHLLAVLFISMVSCQKATGVINLKKKMFLAKLKDAYFHGNEDFYSPQNAQRLKLNQLINEADRLLKSPSQTAHIESLSRQLNDLRKNWQLPLNEFK